ncbi:MAG: hypothetical protein U9R19_16260 [Bacteroidota bacterium]|nr:hypothetical protein [Bacteroidota bacterium]
MAKKTEYWPELYELAIEIKKLAPWDWMGESAIFGVEDPGSGKVNYISIMGQIGEHLSVSAYLGEEGLSKYHYFTDNYKNLPPETILEMPQFMLSFEDRDILGDEDYAIIKNLGLKFRGSFAWPTFKHYSPGFVPYTLEANNHQTMLHILRQTIDVAKRFENNEELIYPPEPEREEHYLIRKPTLKNNEITWTDTYRLVKLADKPIEFKISQLSVDSFNNKPASKNIFVADFFMFPNPVNEPGQKPYFPYLLLLLDKESEMIMGYEMLTPKDGYIEMLSNIPQSLLNQLINHTAKPKKIQVQSQRLYDLLYPMFTNYMSIDLELKPNISAINEAKSMMMNIIG